ncbi:hypothetical protein V8C37DRAFT_403602 [Trichoderma ceciliae]
MPQDSNQQSQQGPFSALYLQRVTQELSEDLDKIRNADDFKAESFSKPRRAARAEFAPQSMTSLSVHDPR